MTHAGRRTRPDKDRPSPEFIAAIRRRYAIERPIDALLTRKLERRAGPGYAPIPLERLGAGVESLLRAQLGDAFRISDARWLSGGASKLQMAFTLDWDRPGVGHERTPLVLRMEPAESLAETSRRREFQLIKAMEGVVPVPPVYWCDEHGEHLPYPGLIYGFAPGVAKPSQGKSGVSGAGTELTPALRRRLAPQFVEHLAKIHGHDFSKADLSAFETPAPGTQCAEWGVSWWERVWAEDGDEEIPLLRVAAAWLRRNLPVLDAPVLVHSDYRLGNFLFTEDDGRITAWLDWELGRIGDRHQDLAWTTSRAFMTLDAAGCLDRLHGAARWLAVLAAPFAAIAVYAPVSLPAAIALYDDGAGYARTAPAAALSVAIALGVVAAARPLLAASAQPGRARSINPADPTRRLPR